MSTGGAGFCSTAKGRVKFVGCKGDLPQSSMVIMTGAEVVIFLELWDLEGTFSTNICR